MLVAEVQGIGTNRLEAGIDGQEGIVVCLMKLFIWAYIMHCSLMAKLLIRTVAILLLLINAGELYFITVTRRKFGELG